MSPFSKRRDGIQTAPPAADTRPLVRNDPVRAMLWITLAMALFSVLATAARKAALMGMPPFEVMFFRNLTAVIFMLPLFIWRGIGLVRSNAPHLYLVRVGVSMISMTAWFYGLALIPVAELTAITFLAPIFGTLAAIVILREKVRLRRWTAILVGFAGAMVMLRPGVGEIGLGQACALVSAMSAGLMAVLLKQLSGQDDPDKIVFLTALLMLPVSLVPALFVWKTPTVEMIPVIITIGITAVLGHVCLMRGYAATDASLVLTFEFSKLPFAAMIGWWAFGEVTDVWTWVGALVIFASAAYITRREAMLRRKAMAAAATPPAAKA